MSACASDQPKMHPINIVQPNGGQLKFSSNVFTIAVFTYLKYNLFTIMKRTRSFKN